MANLQRAAQELQVMARLLGLDPVAPAKAMALPPKDVKRRKADEDKLKAALTKFLEGQLKRVAKEFRRA